MWLVEAKVLALVDIALVRRDLRYTLLRNVRGNATVDI